MDRRLTPSSDLSPTVVQLAGAHDARSLVFGDLSEFFNPFLHHFVQEALGGGGEAWVAQQGSVVRGVLVYNVVEKVGSIFTRDRAVAESLFALKDHLALFSDFSLGPRTELYHIFGSDVEKATHPHRFAHPVRMARKSDRPTVVRMLQEMYGRIDTSWLQAFPQEEKCLVVEIGHEIAGVGWVSVVNGHGRLHSLSVRPRYRRLGIGTDLWHARMLWACQAGARQVLSEISEHNVASLAIATQGGMQRMGQMILSYRSGGRPTVASG
ncbi:MAG: GNAT family N-acetyltransferase [Thermoplasmata archaeon]